MAVMKIFCCTVSVSLLKKQRNLVTILLQNSASYAIRSCELTLRDCVEYMRINKTQRFQKKAVPTIDS